MKGYRVKYRNSSGDYEFLQVRANSAQEAEDLARVQGVFPEAAIEESAGFNLNIDFGVSTTELYHFTRLFSTLSKSGIPLLESLTMLADRTKSAGMNDVLTDILDKIKSGQGLSKSFSDHPKVFDPTYRSLIKVGEESGELYTVLSRLAGLLDRRIKLRRMIQKALAYPLFVMLITLVVTWGILTYIVPRFKDIYSRFGVQLPWISEFVIGCSNFLVAHMFAMAAFFIVSCLIMRMVIKTRPGRRAYDWTMMSLPILGPMNHSYEIAQFSKSFSIMIHSGVTVLGGLETVIPSVERVQVHDALEVAMENIRNGKSMGDSFTEQDPWLPDLLNRMIGVGEKSGNLSEMLEHVSEFYQEEFQNNVETLGSLIEPILMVFLGVIIGGIVVALYLPIFSLAQVVTK